jgi:hypothetical protein
MDGRSLLRAFERREKFLIYGNFYEEFERYVQRPFKRAAIYIGALLGNLEGVYLLELISDYGAQTNRL